MLNTPKWIVIHCSDYSYRNLKNQLEACNGWHRDRQFPVSSLGYFIGYHQFITDGKIHKTRMDNEVGSHCNNHVDGLSINFQSLGVCIGFDGDIEYPTPEDYKLLQEQVWKWQDMYGIPPSRVQFHRYFAKNKTCPGSLITDQWLKDLLTRPKPIEVKVSTCIVDNEIAKKASKWDNLIRFFNSLT